MIHNLIVTGMGGQGVAFITTVIRKALGKRYGRFAGYDDRGGAQRYGHVGTITRFAEDPNYDGPLAIDFPDGHAHWLLALEASEALRYQHKLSTQSYVILDSHLVVPTNVRRNDQSYFDLAELTQHLTMQCGTLIVKDFRKKARALTGSPLDANLLLLGSWLTCTEGLLSPKDFQDIVTGPQGDVILQGFKIIGNERGTE